MAQTHTKQKIIRTEGEFPNFNDFVICPVCKKEVGTETATVDPYAGGKVGKFVHNKCRSAKCKAEARTSEIKYIANTLSMVQITYNEGRGIACIREAVFWLERGEEKKAKLVIEHDWDKIANYPAIANYLKDQRLAKKTWYINKS